MINYYYEIKDDVTVFGHQQKYLAHFDVKPGGRWRLVHDQAVKHSSRVWLENANGVTLIKTHHPYASWDKVDQKELIWLKLICRDIESL